MTNIIKYSHVIHLIFRCCFTVCRYSVFLPEGKEQSCLLTTCSLPCTPIQQVYCREVPGAHGFSPVLFSDLPLFHLLHNIFQPGEAHLIQIYSHTFSCCFLSPDGLWSISQRCSFKCINVFFCEEFTALKSSINFHNFQSFHCISHAEIFMKVTDPLHDGIDPFAWLSLSRHT